MPLDTVSLIELPSCRIVWVDAPLKVHGSLDMEVPIRKLDQSDAEAVVFLGKVGLGISAEHLQQSKVNRYDSIFLILDQYWIKRTFIQVKPLLFPKHFVYGCVFEAVI